MIKEQEQWFLDECRRRISPNGEEFPINIMEEPSFPIPRKQAIRYLEKWAKKGWYDFGCSVRCGWFVGDTNESR